MDHRLKILHLCFIYYYCPKNYISITVLLEILYTPLLINDLVYKSVSIRPTVDTNMS